MQVASRSNMELNRLIVIGASAGGVTALLQLAAELPHGLQAAVLIVLHVGSHQSELPKLMSSRAVLPVAHAQDGEQIEPGTVRVAPPDHHLLVAGGRLLLSRGPKENFARPAIDPLFRSAALAYGPSTVGVVLTGMLDDGTAGLQVVKECGGIAVVQDPQDALEPSMPASALRYVAVDHCLPLAAIAGLLTSLSRQPSDRPHVAPRELWLHEQAMQLGQGDAMDHLAAIGRPSPFACPECHGGLWETADSSPVQYRCHTGHSFTERILEHALATAGDEAGWNALRALQEQQLFLEAMAERRRGEGEIEEQARLEGIARELKARVTALRAMLEATGATDAG